ncbi:Similar to fs(1)h: Homeotic protein female sterile (Drosophila melanogaster) [Cotesia congregata]|uniref:Similar to fs(1)h: Homeotic protein female sterile (Drosophila melanogaster) n=1 Tax=Cotesia congregata TaxID=51543 RepID=A0A8J2H418_COTCN|nr:Similar to fs(1)h: Homeotic protein female sterile (Drosophila melanogaster) [Cotesia congregata]
MEQHIVPSCSGAVDDPTEAILVPINGIVQPAVMPLAGCRGRVTNQLQFLKKNVLEKIWNHDYGKPFRKPVNTIEHNIPDYYKVITNPMDLGTIRKRLSNRYYWSSEDCIKDFKRMFKNCYTYNDPGQDIVVMAQTLEKIFYQKMARMPKKESEVRRESGKIADRSRASSDASVTNRSLEASPREFATEQTFGSLSIENSVEELSDNKFVSTTEVESTERCGG